MENTIGGPGDVSERKPTTRSYDPSFKPQHWADASIFFGFSETVDLQAQI